MRIPGRLKRVRLVADETIPSGGRELFFALHRLRVVNEYDDGSQSPEYFYDTVLRPALDAVVLGLVARIDGEWSVCLRSSIRPPLLLRRDLALAVPERESLFSLWELPAGLIERGDEGEDGLRARAAAEAREETGYRIPPERFELWPRGSFPTAGAFPEKMFFLTAEVDDVRDRQDARGDGSPAEDGSSLWWVSLEESLALCDRGELPDMKTELHIRRLAARYL